MKKYHPDGPYVFKSGGRTGQAVEILMFQDYPFLKYLYNYMKEGIGNERKNSLHLHLEWIFERGEAREPLLSCPICKTEKVRYFFVRRSRSGISANISYTACEKKECIDKITAMGMEVTPERHELKFSSLSRFKRKEEKALVSEIFKKVFLPSGKLSRQKAFKLFVE